MSDKQKQTDESRKDLELEKNPADDEQTDLAVEDIVRHESDVVLAAEDSKLGNDSNNQPGGLKAKIAHVIKAWWGNTRLRNSTLAIFGLVILILALWTPSRDLALNTVGFRGNATVTVLDRTTGLPLKNASALLDGQKVLTNDDGIAVIKGLKLGNQILTVQKIAFATFTVKEIISLGGNDLGRVSLKATGTQYYFTITDYLSGKPVVKAEVTSGPSNAFSDNNGKAVLTALSGLVPLKVVISAYGYRNASITVPASSASTAPIQLVPAGKDVYISNLSGHYNVYTSDIDGQNKQLLLAGTGNENSNVQLIVSPDNEEAALVSTRDNIRDSDGYLLSALTLINISTDTPLTIEHAEQIQLVGWVGTRIVYDETVAGVSAANPERERLMSYDYSKNARTTLATANQLNGVVEADGNIYYGASSTDPSAQLALVKIAADGTSRQTVLNKEIWTIIRTNYNTLALQTPGGWYNYSLSSEQAAQSSQPASFNSYNFTVNQAGDRSLWTDYRDGKGVLLVHDTKTGQDTLVASQDGLTDPTRWLNGDVVIFRVSSQQETADYAVSLQGGTPKKIADVTASLVAGQGY